MAQQLWGWSTKIDSQVTAAYYAQSGSGCACSNCRNFVAALGLLPPAVQTALESLGVDPTKAPAEIMHFVRSSDDRHLYIAFFPVAGTIIEKASSTQKAGTDFDFWFEPDPGFYPLPKDFPRPALQAVLRIWLPWILDEEADSPKETSTAAEIDRLATSDPDAKSDEEPFTDSSVSERTSPWWRRLRSIIRHLLRQT